LTLDIETAPNTGYCWGLWQQNISLNQLIESGYILCWAAKWTDKKGIFSRSKGDADFLTCLHALLSEADAVIHWNGQRFDMPWVHSEMLLAGILPPSPYKQIDLLRTVRSQFKFPSNKLDYVSQALGLGHKTKGMSMDDWKGCMANDEKSWKKMLSYNKKDVALTEKCYFRLLPWIKNHPNINLHEPLQRDSMKCPTCGSENFIARGDIASGGGVYKRYSCHDCGHWFRGHEQVNKINVKNKTSNV
jgi:predicted RNA-binding Zn-ribbon protein involved in translation (DUF1610 family)